MQSHRGGAGAGAGAGAGDDVMDSVLEDMQLDDDMPIDSNTLQLSPATMARLDLLPLTTLGPEQRSTTVNLDLALGGMQQDAIFAPVPDLAPPPTEDELASLGKPFFEVKDPLEAARVNEFRLKYRSFRKGNAKGSKGEMKDTVSQHKMPPFMTKLVKMLEEPSCATCIAWTPDGQGILIKQLDKFSSTVLPRYFKHSNFTTFLRQLNMYSFYTTSQKKGEWRVVANPLFTRDSVSATTRTKRKAPESATPVAPIPSKRARTAGNGTGGGAIAAADASPLVSGASNGGKGGGKGGSKGGRPSSSTRGGRARRGRRGGAAGTRLGSRRPRSAAALLPGSADFLAMSGSLPLSLEAMRAALGAGRARAPGSAQGRRRVDTRAFVTSLLQRQQVLETRLQLAEESHAALLNGYSRLTSELQEMKRLQDHYSSAVKRLHTVAGGADAPTPGVAPTGGGNGQYAQQPASAPGQPAVTTSHTSAARGNAVVPEVIRPSPLDTLQRNMGDGFGSPSILVGSPMASFSPQGAMATDHDLDAFVASDAFSDLFTPRGHDGHGGAHG